MNSARIFASRSHIIDWINQVLEIQMSKIQQLGSGVIYCLLLDSAYPERVQISKLKWYANTEVDYIHNFKILQTSFCHLGIQKKIEINKLIKAKYQDNLDFIQWLKWYLEPKIDEKQYNAKKRRQNKQVYLDFYEHKILKLPFQLNKTKQRLLQKDKLNKKINKKLKKIYNTNDEFLQIFQCRTEESDNEADIYKETSYSKQKTKMLKTASNFRPKKQSNIALHEYMSKSDQEQTQDNKENAYQSMNNTILVNETPMNVQCLYTSPKQIKKFYFPERFSERLKRRVDVINGLRKSEIKNINLEQKEPSKKYFARTSAIYVDQLSDYELENQV